MTSDTAALAIGGQLFLVDVDDDGAPSLRWLPLLGADAGADDDGATLANHGND